MFVVLCLTSFFNITSRNDTRLIGPLLPGNPVSEDGFDSEDLTW